jgi:hypothetical protein
MNYILALLPKRLRAHLEDIPVSPYFSISWILTWFSHDSFNPRLFDLFLARGIQIYSYILRSNHASISFCYPDSSGRR